MDKSKKISFFVDCETIEFDTGHKVMIMDSRIKQFEEIGHLLANSDTYYVNVIDAKGNYIHVNNLFQNKFGVPEKSLINSSIANVLHHDDAEKCARLLREMPSEPSRKRNLELRLHKPNSSDVVWTNWEISVHITNSGDVSYFHCVGYDLVGKESMINYRLLSYSKRIDRILNSVTDGFFTLDKDWRIVKVNQLFLNLSKKTKAQLLGKIFWEEYPEYSKYVENKDYLASIEKEEAFQMEIFSEKRNKWFLVKVYPYSEGLTVFFQDVTENKKHIEEITQKNKILTEIARLQSHQIRRPVATMLGLSQLFEKEGMTEENLQLLDLLQKTTLELDEVIHKVVHKANSVIKKSKNPMKED